jgi:FMN phosphatase YigB (HAD superfamily)
LIEAVTFDYWNTLVHERPGQLTEGRLAAWIELLEASGTPVDHGALVDAHEVAFQEYQTAWKSGRQYVVADATDCMLRNLRLEVGSDVHDALVASFDSAGAATDLQLAPGVEKCLRDLRATGVVLGIVCDVGLTPSTTLLGHLRRLGVLDVFSTWAFSDTVGAYKPDPALFGVALDALGVAPARAAHVGDRLRTDLRDGVRPLRRHLRRSRGRDRGAGRPRRGRPRHL